ncbi:MAG: Thymidylate kinase (EC [uncultured Thiotrichaceae bacterium]|uniref:Thymidylate kinase (EC) n=1 Tax=uncultured Thiotrichaceae bacterium TaxID=298394 RepID=A0A6S6SWE7_9GAMM|nr:MAG: Thymidylate kinase (EC [uncultured Thiotrichaceae bacterium]
MRQLIILLMLFVSTSGYTNDLKNHASPYLAMHGDDPVQWMEWGDAALAKAKKENKLLFVSVGYFACHWCHVMHRESFKNKAIAKKLNQNYISVKIDRELNPVVDKRLIEFVTATVGRAGWPLSVFITPDGYPLVGATYIPPKQFSNAIDDLAGRWKESHKQLRIDAEELNLKLKFALEMRENVGSERAVADNVDTFIKAAMENADELEGGLGSSMKFPSIPQFHALLKLNAKHNDPEIHEFLKHTLDVMAQKGLHDELAGGFYRYTVDPSWLTPHFEKMLYTNALMPILYLDAAKQYDKPYYKDVALETLQFLIDEMRAESGAFIASLSAVDDKNEEGGYYLWTQAELGKILSKDELKLANKAWNMDQPNELVSGNLPMMKMRMKGLSLIFQQPEAKITERLTALKKKLKTHRNKTRVIPKDNKELTGWNGLTLAGFARALSTDKALQPVGDKLADFLLQQWDGKQLNRARKSLQEGTLNDYAAVSWGLLEWAKASGNEKAKLAGEQIAKIAWNTFYIDGNWRESINQLLPEGTKQAHLTDDPMPSAEALLIRASLLSADEVLQEKAKKVLKHSTKAVEDDPYSYASLISISLSKPPVQK